MEYSEQIIQQVWEQGRAISDLDSTVWRQDQCGAWMMRDKYEYAHSDYGWKIRSISPGDSGVEDRRPFQYQNEINGANGQVQCKITADRTGLQPTEHIDQPCNKPV